MGKVTKKSRQRPSRGRPKIFQERRNVLVSLEPQDIAWLDQEAEKAQISRTELVMALVSMFRQLHRSGYVTFQAGGMVWFRPILSPSFIKSQVLSGEFDYDKTEGEWVMGVSANKTAIRILNERLAQIEPVKSRKEAK